MRSHFSISRSGDYGGVITDPDANLKEQLDLARQLLDEGMRCEPSPEVERLAELVEALDGWLGKGGFLPRRWERSKNIVRLEDVSEISIS
jgi:hypothetical protein